MKTQTFVALIVANVLFGSSGLARSAEPELAYKFTWVDGVHEGTPQYGTLPHVEKSGSRPSPLGEASLFKAFGWSDIEVEFRYTSNRQRATLIRDRHEKEKGNWTYGKALEPGPPAQVISNLRVLSVDFSRKQEVWEVSIKFLPKVSEEEKQEALKEIQVFLESINNQELRIKSRLELLVFTPSSKKK